MLPVLLAKIGLPVLIKTVSDALDNVNNPVAKAASTTLKQVDHAITAGSITQEELQEANRHVEKMTEIDSEEAKIALTQINESLRAEIASQDKYVRRMRPTFGYIMAFTWAAQMLAIAFVILDSPEQAGHVMRAMGDLDTIWTVGLSVLGIYVYKRSQEKKKGK